MAFERLFLRVDGVEYDLLMGDLTDDYGCSVNVLAEGASWGVREARLTTLTTMMRHGDRVAHTGSGNRRPTLNLVITGPDLAALAWTEEVYQRATGRPGELVWLPPDDTAEACVFDVVWSDLTFALDDLGELRCSRHFTLEMQALPFARPEEPVVVSGISADLTMVTDCTSLTGWTGSHALSVVAGAIVSTTTDGIVSFTYTAAIPVPVGSFLAVDYTGPAGGGVGLRYNTATHTDRIAEHAGTIYIGSGTYRFFYRINPPGSTITAFTLRLIRGAASGSWSPAVAQVSVSTAASHQREQTAVLIPGGSAPTQGSLRVTHGVNDLGRVLVATGPVGSWSPPLSSRWSWWGAGVRSTDAGSPSGYVWDVDTYPFEAFASVVDLPTKSAAVWILARADSAGVARIEYKTESWIGGSLLPGTVAGGEFVTFASTGYELHPLGVLPTPATAMGGSGSALISVKRASGETKSIDIREVYLCPIGDEYGLTVVNDVPALNLWINAPDAANPTGSMMVGDTAEDAYYPTGGGLPGSIGAGYALPEGMQVYVVTTGAVGAMVDLTAYPRHMNHVTRHPSLDVPVESVE